MRMLKITSKYIKYNIFHILIFILFNLVVWSTTLSIQYIISKFIDSIIVSKSINSVLQYSKTLFLLIFTYIVTSYLKTVLLTKLKINMGYKLNFDILQYVKKLPLPFFFNTNTVYLNQRINSDSNTIINFITENIVDALVQFIMFIIMIYLMLSINISVTLLLLIILPLDVLLYFIFKKPIYFKSYNMKEQQNKFFSSLNEQISNIKLTKLNSWFDTGNKKMEKSFYDLFKSAISYTKLTSLFSSFDLSLTYIMTLILFIFGGYEIINGGLTIGQFTLINNYSKILLGIVSFFLGLSKTYQDTLVSCERINSILKLEPEHNGNIKIDGIKEISVEDLSYSYDNKCKIVDKFTFKFQIGNVYCIIGQNGMGKTTLLDILVGLYSKYEGEIFYNSINIKEIDLYDARNRLIGFAEQEPCLVNSSIMNNLTYGLENINKEIINEYCKEINVLDFINSLPNKFDFIVEQDQSNISGGEKQKLALARILIKNTDVIILDEPTSALDEKSIEKLKAYLKKAKREKIIIIVTHNNNFTDIADTIIDLNII